MDLLTVHPWIKRKVLEVLLKVQAVRDSSWPGMMKQRSSSGWEGLRRENLATVEFLASSGSNKSFRGSRKLPGEGNTCMLLPLSSWGADKSSFECDTLHRQVFAYLMSSYSLYPSG